MGDRIKILILFEGNHLAYSPAIAQLHESLKPFADITILAPDPEVFSKNTELPYDVEVYKYPTGLIRGFYKLWHKLLLYTSPKAKLVNELFPDNYEEYFFRFGELRKAVESGRFNLFICVDLKNLFFVNAVLKQRCFFLSLELCFCEKALPYIDTALLDCVIIQSSARYQYLFKNKELKTFYIQNAPVFDESVIREQRKGLVYSGTAWKPFGFSYCLDYLLENPDEQLIVQGQIKDDTINENNRYKELVVQGRLIINEKYLPDEALVPFLAGFEIGFCFYNFDVEWVNNFNYQSAPAGKLFKYIAAGVPVICNRILGFDFVDEFGCGIRLDQFDPASIRSAVEEIRRNYAAYVRGAIKAARHFSYDKAVIPFLEFAVNKLQDPKTTTQGQP